MLTIPRATHVVRRRDAGSLASSLVMTSFVVRVLTSELTTGQLAGEVESVETGAREVFRGGDALLAFCRGQAAFGELPTPLVLSPPVDGVVGG